MGVIRPRETLSLVRWRDASRRAVESSRTTGEAFAEYLALGGPDAIKSLQATLRKLQSQLEELKLDGRLERYRKLQKDLEEADKVMASLRQYLITECNIADEEVDAWLQRKHFKASTLYGASRELLLRENRLLRAQLEEHLVTTRTSRGPGAGRGGGVDAGTGAGSSPGGGRSRAGGGGLTESRLRTAKLLQGPHMEVVGRLLEATDALDQAERAYQLPTVAHAEVEADDGSRRLIATLESQLATLAGQKMQLMSQVAGLQQQNGLLDMKLEAAHDQLVELRRHKTEMLAHAENLSKDLRDHMVSEAKRADAAELAAAEARSKVAGAEEAAETARSRMEGALAEAQAMQAALQEKEGQVDTLRGLYMELRETLEKLAGDVASGQREVAARVLEATRENFLDQRQLLEDVKGSAVGAHRAAQHSTAQVTELAAQQRQLVSEAQSVHHAATVTLSAYERQLAATQQLLMQSEADRVRLARQAIAASALNRLEDRRHKDTVQLLLQEVPDSVAGRLGPELAALAEGQREVAAEMEHARASLEAGGAGGGGAGRLLHPPLVPDAVEDATTQVLQDSRLLRSQLHQLSAGAPGAAPPHLNTAPLFRELPAGVAPFPAAASGGQVDVAWRPPPVPDGVPYYAGAPAQLPGGPSYLTDMATLHGGVGPGGGAAGAAAGAGVGGGDAGDVHFVIQLEAEPPPGGEAQVQEKRRWWSPRKKKPQAAGAGQPAGPLPPGAVEFVLDVEPPAALGPGLKPARLVGHALPVAALAAASPPHAASHPLAAPPALPPGPALGPGAVPLHLVGRRAASPAGRLPPPGMPHPVHSMYPPAGGLGGDYPMAMVPPGGGAHHLAAPAAAAPLHASTGGTAPPPAQIVGSVAFVPDTAVPGGGGGAGAAPGGDVAAVVLPHGAVAAALPHVPRTDLVLQLASLPPGMEGLVGLQPVSVDYVAEGPPAGVWDPHGVNLLLQLSDPRATLAPGMGMGGMAGPGGMGPGGGGARGGAATPVPASREESQGIKVLPLEQLRQSVAAEELQQLAPAAGGAAGAAGAPSAAEVHALASVPAAAASTATAAVPAAALPPAEPPAAPHPAAPPAAAPAGLQAPAAPPPAPAAPQTGAGVSRAPSASLQGTAAAAGAAAAGGTAAGAAAAGGTAAGAAGAGTAGRLPEGEITLAPGMGLGGAAAAPAPAGPPAGPPPAAAPPSAPAAGGGEGVGHKGTGLEPAGAGAAGARDTGAVADQGLPPGAPPGAPAAVWVPSPALLQAFNEALKRTQQQQQQQHLQQHQTPSQVQQQVQVQQLAAPQQLLPGGPPPGGQQAPGGQAEQEEQAGQWQHHPPAQVLQVHP